ncbi:hypothetical protein ACWD01_25970 [Streptomyces sp. NPDC002835]
MLEIAPLSAASGGTSYLYLAWEAVIVVIGFTLLFNVRDCAYRIHGFFMERSPFGSGRGFSPLIVRIVGFILVVPSLVAIAASLAGS